MTTTSERLSLCEFDFKVCVIIKLVKFLTKSINRNVDGQVSSILSKATLQSGNAKALKRKMPKLRLLYCFYSKEHYDRGVNTFSPEGRIYQIEYAIEAIKVSPLPSDGGIR